MKDTMTKKIQIIIGMTERTTCEKFPLKKTVRNI